MPRIERYPGWKDAIGNRPARVGLVEPILDVLSKQIRAVGPRRVSYFLIDNYRHDPEVIAALRPGKDQTPKEALDERVGGTLAVMREIGLVEPWLISDGKSTEEHPYTVEDADEYMEDLRNELPGLRLSRQAGQKQRIEIWTEAQDTIPSLRRVTDEYGIPVISSGGVISLKARDNAGRRMIDDRRPTLILYCGDYDPAGLAIPERLQDIRSWALRWDVFYRRAAHPKWEGKTPREQWASACEYLRDFPEDLDDYELEVVRVAIEPHDLPGRYTTPVKRDLIEKTAKPGSGAYARFWPKGETRTLQLEAIPVEELVRRIQDEINIRIDRTILDAVLDKEEEEREKVRHVLDR